jgi:hypothetical protein
MSRRQTQIHKYEAGMNPTIDRLRDEDEEVWVVNSAAGRRVVILPLDSTEEDAWNTYQDRFMKKEEAA